MTEGRSAAAPAQGQCSSASRKFLNIVAEAYILPELDASALQRAENSSICNPREGYELFRLPSWTPVLFSEPKIPQYLSAARKWTAPQRP